VAGLDEAGRGSLAGPVVAAAVVLGRRFRADGINDSKLLTPRQRDALLRVILRGAEAWSIGSADAKEIDRNNILVATRMAMARALEALRIRPDHLLIDAVRLPAEGIGQTPLIKGDRISVSIAAASIVAKVIRDRIMEHYDRLYPGFGFGSNRGYGTPLHLRAVARKGACPVHRLTFRGVRPDEQRVLNLTTEGIGIGHRP